MASSRYFSGLRARTVCRASQDIGARLLQSVGLSDPTEEQIEAAISTNDKFIEELQRIAQLGANGARGAELMAMPPQLRNSKRRRPRNSEPRPVIELMPSISIHDVRHDRVDYTPPTMYRR